MEWIFFSVALCLAVLAGIIAMVGKPRDGQSVKGHFDFDRYKQNELSKRGLFDKTKW